jgi:hypothetical protein
MADSILEKIYKHIQGTAMFAPFSEMTSGEYLILNVMSLLSTETDLLNSLYSQLQNSIENLTEEIPEHECQPEDLRIKLLPFQVCPFARTRLC